jgi:hypothetical protein
LIRDSGITQFFALKNPPVTIVDTPIVDTELIEKEEQKES